jgi:hypothetical protein
MQTAFGSGIMWGTPLTDATGTAIVNPTPVLFGILQDITIDISADVKELYGQLQYPFAVGRGKGKITGKAKMAQIFGQMYNSLFFGQTLNTGFFQDVYTTTALAIPPTPFTITVSSVASSATNIQIPNAGVTGSAADLGVINAATGLPMTRVASAPTAGQYSFTPTTGVYLFSSADNVSGVSVYINYQYTATSTTAKNSVVANLPMGYAPTFECDLMLPYGGKQLTLDLYNCIATKLTFPSKLDDFTIPELDFSAFANAGGQVMKWGTNE